MTKPDLYAAASHPGAQNLWAITCYFNPFRYRRRIDNYRLFRRHLGVPLVAVELSFNKVFELGPGDAEVLVQIRGGDVMWQKERLLNVALQYLPPVCDKVAWLDCDIVFADDTWHQRANAALDECRLLHLFSERCDLPANVLPQEITSRGAPPSSYSVVYRQAMGNAAPEDYYLANAPLERGSTAGLAWASPRAVLEEHGLYDACILGSGDRGILCAAIGEFGHGVRALHMDAERANHYLSWAGPYYETVCGRVGYIPGSAMHLWHGDIADRQYQQRHEGLREHRFDPRSDIAVDENGCWRWNSNKPRLHRMVENYFRSRNEDG